MIRWYISSAEELANKVVQGLPAEELLASEEMRLIMEVDADIQVGIGRAIFRVKFPSHSSTARRLRRPQVSLCVAGRSVEGEGAREDRALVGPHMQAGLWRMGRVLQSYVDSRVSGVMAMGIFVVVAATATTALYLKLLSPYIRKTRDEIERAADLLAQVRGSAADDLLAQVRER